MTVKKHRQGQREAIPKPVCQKCGEIMRRVYKRDTVDRKGKFIEAGWMCSSSACDYIIKDLVEFEDIQEEEETESINEPEND